MICACWLRASEFGAFGRRAAETARAMLGLPDYDAYLTHLGALHPDRKPMSRAEFVSARQAARYGAGGMRCC